MTLKKSNFKPSHYGQNLNALLRQGRFLVGAGIARPSLVCTIVQTNSLVPANMGRAITVLTGPAPTNKKPPAMFSASGL
ncbi:MAG: hypothetical protein FWD97_08300 [Defluviitaleaceae bacterium]|nr:hypothetical protein [Defluviitaleaceae bacterium]